MDTPAGTIIRTTRLILDPLRDEDTAAVFAYRSDQETSRYQGWKPADEAEVARFIAQLDNGWFDGHTEGNAGDEPLAAEA